MVIILGFYVSSLPSADERWLNDLAAVVRGDTDIKARSVTTSEHPNILLRNIEFGGDVSPKFHLRMERGTLKAGVWVATLDELDNMEAVGFSDVDGGVVEVNVPSSASNERWYVITAGPLAETVLLHETDGQFGERFLVFSEPWACHDNVRPSKIIGAPTEVCSQLKDP